MTFLKVGTDIIPVTPGGAGWDWNSPVDRRRAFDNTYRASATGGAAREFRFTSPPLTRTAASTYRATLARVEAQLCSGDVIESPTMCCAEILNEAPVKTPGSHMLTINFALHEVQGKRLLFKYTPGDAITGETFTRSTTAFYQNNAGVLVSRAIDGKRDAHFAAGVASLLLEGSRTNAFLRSQEVNDAAWTKGAATITADATAAPDGTTTADKLVETATTAEHVAYQTITTTASTLQPPAIFVKAGERTWCWIRSNLRDGTTPTSWINLATGAIGTKAAAHTIRVRALAGGWYRIELVVNSGVGAGAVASIVGTATGDNVSSFLGDITKGIYLWGEQHEQDKPFATSYYPTTTVAATRGGDLYSLPFTLPPGELSVYVNFIESGSILIPSAGVFSLSAASGAAPALFCYSTGSVYRAAHSTATASVVSDLAAAPAILDTVELLVRLYGDGSVDLTQSINGGAATTSTQSGANALAAAWSGPLLWLNSLGNTNAGFTAIQSFKIVAGSRSLSDMRAA